MAKKRKPTTKKKQKLLCSSSSYSTDVKVSDEMKERNENVDRFSSLPEDILHLIFSSFDLSEVIKLSVLSKFWWGFWKSLPYIYFSANNFDDENDNDLDDYELYQTFESFVEKTLRIRGNHPIYTFHLFLYYQDSSIPHIRSWVRNVVMRKVQKIYLALDNPHFAELLDLPHSLFSCESLTSLFLTLSLNPGTWFEVPLPDSIDLPRLKTLSLQSISKMSTEFLSKFILGCPILEHLYINFCEFEESSDHLIISSLQLKDLLIQRCLPLDDDPYGYKITVSAPNLTSFTCGDLHVTDFYIENLSLLETAKLNMAQKTQKDRYEENKDKISGRVVKCLKVLHNVKSLTLDSCALKVVSKALDLLKTSGLSFDNIRSLNVALGIGKDYLEALKYIFDISSNVERLKLKLVRIDESSASTASYLEEQFSLNNVKYIKVAPVKGFVYELEFLKNLLKFAMTLETMTVISPKKFVADDKEIKLKVFSDELEHAPVASSTAKVSFIASDRCCEWSSDY